MVEVVVGLFSALFVVVEIVCCRGSQLVSFEHKHDHMVCAQPQGVYKHPSNNYYLYTYIDCT